MTRRIWQQWEKEALRQFFSDHPTQWLADALRRSCGSVAARAKKLGLRKSEAFLNSDLSGRNIKGRSFRNAGTFGKGHVPHNKGVRRPGWHVGRMRESQFRPGHVPSTWRPIGTEVVDRDGYRKRKVREGAKPATYNWDFVHVLLWIEHFGSVPSGHAVVFRNGNRADIRIENLETVSRAELMRRNTIHRLPAELADVCRLKGALTRKINRRSA